MKRLPSFLSWVVLAVAAAIAGLAFLQPWNALASPAGITLLATTTSDFTYQGRLTNAVGQPVPNGSYAMTFRLYEDSAAPIGSALATAVATPTVSGGLFVVNLSGFASYVDGRDLYIGVQVGSDPELSPRQRITPVPYALSLRPGATISGSEISSGFCLIGTLCPPGSVLYVRNTSTDPPDPLIGPGAGIVGRGNEGYGVWGGSETNSGVVGRTLSVVTGTGAIVGYGPTGGNALYASGSGRIASEAPTKLWISGQSFVKNLSGDLTTWDMEEPGSAQIRSGNAAGGTRNIYLPVTVPAQQYGVDTVVESATVYYRRSGTAFITRTALWRLNPATGSFLTMIEDETDRTSSVFASYTLDTSNNNRLTAGNGGMSVFLELQFSNNTDYVELYGVELTLRNRH
ncbi:MAG: hypothetical protein KatS3mg060_2564 [Dehalococcoidia bacterium]|nr:MAG: hypothetical protein KatS3mg060_2564 [Dehalococcoidia bacterium]